MGAINEGRDAMRRVMTCVVLLALSGCADLLSQKRAELSPTRATTNKGEMVTLPAQLRSVTFKNSAGDFISCSEPAPDHLRRV